MNRFYILTVATVVSITALSHPASAVTFGTKADGTPITWTESLGGGTAVVDGNGYLQITASDPTAQLDFSGSPLVFGSASAVRVVWEDENTGGSGTLPRIDFLAQDLRAGKLLNRVIGGSLFAFGHYGAIRWNAGTNPGNPTQELYTGESDVAEPRAAAGATLVHTLLIQKLASGHVDFTYDGDLITHSDTFMNALGLGTDHSLWDTAQLRVRFAEPGEIFTFRSIEFVPEPSGAVLLGVAMMSSLIVGRRRFT